MPLPSPAKFRKNEESELKSIERNIAHRFVAATSALWGRSDIFKGVFSYLGLAGAASLASEGSDSGTEHTKYKK